MSDTLVAAIISSISTLITPWIGYFVYGLIKTKTLKLFKKGNKFHCTWEFDDQSEPIIDEVEVLRTWFRKINCIGRVVLNGNLKQYRLKGKVYNYCITFEFLGTDNGQHDETAGVIIFKRTKPNIEEFEGIWSQLNIHGELIGGKVIWNRKSSHVPS